MDSLSFGLLETPAGKASACNHTVARLSQGEGSHTVAQLFQQLRYSKMGAARAVIGLISRSQLAPSSRAALLRTSRQLLENGELGKQAIKSGCVNLLPIVPRRFNSSNAPLGGFAALGVSRRVCTMRGDEPEEELLSGRVNAAARW
ncbi:hypothetical protein CYMTET_6984 [Cymbomonas tetramitiformis]|uniref:Uncharacterized protein n=1 Tax=Cymbomonas tetramitiformis TaxID=36881 RepID=A0AAE0GW47_9CHLO|nr:hypothetical protein CYMTET_6984 [Cymbomonas tetramitiformis]